MPSGSRSRTVRGRWMDPGPRRREIVLPGPGCAGLRRGVGGALTSLLNRMVSPGSGRFPRSRPDTFSEHRIGLEHVARGVSGGNESSRRLQGCRRAPSGDQRHPLGPRPQRAAQHAEHQPARPRPGSRHQRSSGPATLGYAKGSSPQHRGRHAEAPLRRASGRGGPYVGRARPSTRQRCRVGVS